MPTYSRSIDSRLMWKGLMWEGGPAQGDVVGLSYVRGSGTIRSQAGLYRKTRSVWMVG